MGSAFNDALTGSTAANVLMGLAGNDTLNGGSGADTLVGGAGNDIMNGNDGNDTFVFAPGFGNDAINGFDANPFGGQDFLDISEFGITSANFASRVVIDRCGRRHARHYRRKPWSNDPACRHRQRRNRDAG